jgi:hypothetical protein
MSIARRRMAGIMQLKAPPRRQDRRSLRHGTAICWSCGDLYILVSSDVEADEGMRCGSGREKGCGPLCLIDYGAEQGSSRTGTALELHRSYTRELPSREACPACHVRE